MIALLVRWKEGGTYAHFHFHIHLSSHPPLEETSLSSAPSQTRFAPLHSNGQMRQVLQICVLYSAKNLKVRQRSCCVVRCATCLCDKRIITAKQPLLYILISWFWQCIAHAFRLSNYGWYFNANVDAFHYKIKPDRVLFKKSQLFTIVENLCKCNHRYRMENNGKWLPACFSGPCFILVYLHGS